MKRKSKSSQRLIVPTEQLLNQLNRFKPLLSVGEFEELLEELKNPLLPTIRVNLLKTKPGFIQSMAEHYGWSYSAIPFCPTGFRIESNPGAPISSVLEHKLGMFYIQEAASMLPVELFHFNLSPSEITLDLAASPGGKTTHLIDRSHDTGLVIANDSSQGRIQALKIVLQHWGAVSAAVTRFPGENFGRWFPNTFDRALIDAPCSMQGLRTADSHSSRPVTEKESKNLSRRQISLLISALQAVRVGAEVVYSTCTLVPEEDEGVVETVLKKLGNAVNLINAQEILPQPAPGVQKDENGEYENSMTNTIRFWPHRYHTAGFFTCLFRKNVELDLPSSSPPEHSMEKAGFFELSGSERKDFTTSFEIFSGYPLEKYLELNHRVLVRHNNRIFIFPSLLLDRFRTLPVQSAGILLGEEEPDGFIPSQEWVLRFGADCPKIIAILDEDQFKVFVTGGDLVDYSDPSNIDSPLRIVMDSQRLVLGRGKMISGTLKNLSNRQFT